MSLKARSFFRAALALSALGLFLALPGLQQGISAAGLHDPQTDVQSLDSILKAFYESLTFTEGSGPDWDRFRNLFASSTVPFVRTTPGAVLVTDLGGFLNNFGGRIKSGTLKSFREEETFRSTESYGSFAQMISTYRKGLNTADPQKSIRGINSFQLFFKDGRWWIASLMWEDESQANPIPAKYIR